MRGEQDRHEREGHRQDRDTGRRQERQLTRGSDDRPMPGQHRGEWVGYVQPYRYYGPGYRGVGYYSVLYQGPDAGPMDGSQTAGNPAQVEHGDAQYGQHPTIAGPWERSAPHGAGDRLGAWADRARQWASLAPGSGQYAGRGPKGYRRSDERIREDVSDRLTEHPDLDASEIEVSVTDGEVTLMGAVDTRWAKRLAEDLAESTTGVRDVMNQLRVPADTVVSEPMAAPGRQTQPQARNGRRPVGAKR